VRDLEAKLAAARRGLATVTPASGADMGRSRLESIDGELTGAKARLAKAEARVNACLSTPPGAVEGVRTNPQVARFRENLAELKREQAELEARSGRTGLACASCAPP